MNTPRGEPTLPPRDPDGKFLKSCELTQRRLTATLSPTNQRAESKGNRWHARDVIAACAIQTLPSKESRTVHTNQIRTWYNLVPQRCSNVVLPFLHTGPYVSFKLISSRPDFDVSSTQQRVVVMINFMCMSSGNASVNVFKSDAVFWWPSIFCKLSSLGSSVRRFLFGRSLSHAELFSSLRVSPLVVHSCSSLRLCPLQHVPSVGHRKGKRTALFTEQRVLPINI